jgi:hypothetical protein
VSATRTVRAARAVGAPRPARRRRAAWAALVTVLIMAASVGAAQSALTGVWAAQRVNRQALPMTDRVVGDDGFTHAVRLQEMTLRLRPNGRFTAALQYRRAILSRGERIEAARLQNDVWQGTWRRTGDALLFVPEKNGDRTVAPFDGRVSGQRISVAFDYDIVTRKRYVLDLVLDPDIW